MIATCLDNPYPFPEVMELKLPSGLTNGGFLDVAVDFAAAQLRQVYGAFLIAPAAVVDEHLDFGIPPRVRIVAALIGPSLGASMKVGRGSIRTSIQGSCGSAAVAA